MTAGPVASNTSSAHPDAANRPYREVTDFPGRVYRVGDSDRDILGHSRKLLVSLPWIAMMAISVFGGVGAGLVYGTCINMVTPRSRTAG